MNASLLSLRVLLQDGCFGVCMTECSAGLCLSTSSSTHVQGRGSMSDIGQHLNVIVAHSVPNDLVV